MKTDDTETGVAWSVREPGAPRFLSVLQWPKVLAQADHWRRKFLWPPTFPHTLRMNRLELNHPGTTGYSALAFGHGVWTIHAHREGKQDVDYAHFDQFSSDWIYMPISPGEYLTEICVISPPRWNNLKSTGLAFITNRGRATSFAPFKPKEAILPYERIYTPPRHGSTIYFGAAATEARRQRRTYSDDYIFHFAYHGATLPVPQKCPAPFEPSSLPMEAGHQYRLYFSSLNLENVIEVTLCVSKGDFFPEGVCGLLVRYANGDKACVGSFRFDWAAETYQVRRGDGLYLGITEKPNHFTYDKEPPLRWVREVRFDSPVEKDGVSWMAVPWSGKLEFWLSRQQSRVYHTER